MVYRNIFVQPSFAIPQPPKRHKQPLAFSVASHRAASATYPLPFKSDLWPSVKEPKSGRFLASNYFALVFISRRRQQWQIFNSGWSPLEKFKRGDGPQITFCAFAQLRSQRQKFLLVLPGAALASFACPWLLSFAPSGLSVCGFAGRFPAVSPLQLAFSLRFGANREISREQPKP